MIVALKGTRAGKTQCQTCQSTHASRKNPPGTLKAAGIPTAIYYPKPLHQQTAYRDFPIAGNGTPVSDRLTTQVLSLPMHPYLSEQDQDRVISALSDAMANAD